MPHSSKSKKEKLNEILDQYIINYKRFTGKYPSILPVSDAEGLFIRGLIVAHMSKKENCDQYHYEVSNNPELDCILVWQSIEICQFQHQEDVDRMRDAVR